MNKSISIVLALTSIVLLVSFGKTDASCDGDLPTTSAAFDPVVYCLQFYTAAGANPGTDCGTGRDNDCHGGLICLSDSVGNYKCECPLYKAVQSQIGYNAYTAGSFTCTSPLLDKTRRCKFTAGAPCGANWFCSTNTCTNNIC